MNAAAAIILGPLAAAAAILLVRRWAPALAAVGALVGLAAAGRTLVLVVGGATLAAELPGLPGLPLRLVADPLAALLATVVAVVGLLVLAYAVGYMEGERDQVRFYAAMAFFVAAMQALVLAGDWLLFLAGWELIGLASYLLIGFWFERPGVAAAATRAFATTRAADLGLYVGIFALTAAAGTTEIAATLAVGGPAATLAGLALLVAAMGKSAQAPLQGWLMDAMAGPTPVSALLHAATLVVAGVVLLTRASPLLPDDVRLFVGLVGGVTAVAAGVTAVAQSDLKRLLAASTSSQLGLMLLAIGAGSVGAAIVHLVANAAMKSALFLGAGVFQHARDSTAFAALAGVGRERRLAFVAVVVAGLALAGVPPLAGFWSKDAVIAAALDAPARALLLPLAWLGSALTGVYVARFLRLLWEPVEPRRHEHRRDDPGRMWMGLGLAALAALAAVLGLAVAPIGELLGTEIPENVLAVAVGLLAAAIGLAAGWFVTVERLLGPAYGLARDGFRVDGGLDELIVRPALALARAGDWLDRAIHAAVLGVGGGALVVAAAAWRVDSRIHAGVEGVGAAAMSVARASRFSDEAGIERWISNLVEGTRRLGARARLLQTGLVHRELLLAAGATAVVLLLVVLS
jgi:NADH-quinone oxidoreductase subunit L